MAVTPSTTQRAAIEAPLGPILVVAGPGAGKTFCLINRIGHLITEQGVAPERILAVTFTNKAAEEIAERLETELGHAARHVERGTLHALCATLLREHGSVVSVEPGFGVADERYQALVLERLGTWRKRRSQLLGLFGRRRLDGYQLSARDEQLFERYVQHLRRRNMLDFDDLVSETARLMREHADVAALIRGRWDAVLVDEFQDLNPAQYEILSAFAREHGNLFAVGDDEQSIYSWAGADPRILRRMADDFGVAEPIVLDRNRRCSVQIFQTARRLLIQNPTLFDKEIAAERKSSHEVTAYRFADEHQEAAWLVKDLRADRERSRRDWGDYALLYRMHSTGNHLEATLVEAGIPCRLARGRSLKDDPAIQYVLAALRLLVAPDDPVLTEALAEIRIPNLVGQLQRAARDSERELLPTVRELAAAKPKTDPDRSKLWRFFYDVENLRALPKQHGDLMTIVESLLAKPVGEYTNVLERRHDELSDPEDDPAVVSLAERLEPALDGRAPVRLARRGGIEIAVRGMLLEGGVTTVDYAASVADDPLDAPPLQVFKALQLVHSRQLSDPVADFTTFDLETTGLDVDQCEIVEIGAVRVRDGKPVERFHRLVKPFGPIDAAASETHGYTAEDLRDAPSFAAVWPEFRAFVGDDLLVAHNGFEFDIPVLDRRVEALGDLEEVARFKDLTFFDSLPLARDLVAGNARLENLAATFGIPLEKAHHALDDAEALAGVFRELQQLEAARVRKTSLSHALDWLAVGLALERAGAPRARGDGATSEADVLFEAVKIFPLGPYSDVLEQYGRERAHLADDAIPTVEQLIAALGGQRLMQRLRVERTAEQRYPEAVARLRAVVQATECENLAEHVARFLDRVTLTTSEGADVSQHRVNLLTLHSTKGLEFDCVYLVGIEDGEFFLGRAEHEIAPAELEEARRLVYVGMTRAIDRLVITMCDRREGYTHGHSRFLEEMGVEVVSPF